MGTERYKVTLAYDGTLFFGFQRQGTDRTVQLALEATLRQLGWQGRAILSSGRTDSGVHASGQVVTFDLDWPHGTEKLKLALNAKLPDDVAVKSVEVAAADFHPRYDAASRTYRYQIQFARERDPLRDRYVWRVWPPCEAGGLDAAARLLHGAHDFAVFGTPPRPGGSTIRTVYAAKWHTDAEWSAGGEEPWWFDVTATGFLYHMVRRMVFVQVLVGQRRLSLERLQEAVELGRPLPPGLAPPQGLTLRTVTYGPRRERPADEEPPSRQVTPEE